MASQTEMIFLTSDEDLVRQISSKKSTNTRIIDLDEYRTLRQVSQINSAGVQAHQPIRNLIDHNQSKKSSDSTCKICGDRAIGFNYDVLSCASCKAFFRRNAYQQPEELKCITRQDECVVVHGINRKCHRCRLKRCFAMGMRKDFIVKKEEKKKKKKRLETNENVSSNPETLRQELDQIEHLLVDLDQNDEYVELEENNQSHEIEDNLWGRISVEDRMTIQNLQSLFVSTMQDDNAHRFSIDTSDRDAAMMSCLQSADQTALRFVNFFRQINEFEGLDADDRFTLMKYNVLPALPIYKCFNYKPENHYLSYEDNEEGIKFGQFCRLFDQTYDIRGILIKLITSLVELTKQDPTILSLILIIVVFSQGLSMNEDAPVLKNSLAAHRIQSHYIEILWHYLANQWNEKKTCEYFTQLLSIIFQLQSSSKIFRDFICIHPTTRNNVDQITPLMQTFLNIS